MHRQEPLPSQLLTDPCLASPVQIPTLVEYIKLAQGAKRTIGIYPETKHPSFFDSLNLGCFPGGSFTDAVLKTLQTNGYTGAVNSPAWREKPVFLQSFEVRGGAGWMVSCHELQLLLLPLSCTGHARPRHPHLSSPAAQQPEGHPQQDQHPLCAARRRV